MTTAIEFDAAKAEAFAERMLTVLNDGALAVMISIGHRTGLFDSLAALPPVTSHELATAAGLNERYVREWLAALVTGGIIDYDPRDRTYQLVAEHAAWLTRAASPHNMATTFQFIPLAGRLQEPILEVFRSGGGLPYAEYPDFHDIMAEDSAQTVVAGLVDTIVPLVPGLAQALSDGIDVLDVGCGRGKALLALAQAYPRSRFTGYELSLAMTATVQAQARALGLTNLHFVAQDAATFDAPARYDLICAFDAIHDQADPAQVLRNINRALRPDGTFLMQDIRASSELHKNMQHPAAPLLYTISTIHCMSVSLSSGGAGLGTMWGEELALAMLADAGFASVEVRQLPQDFLNNYYIARVHQAQ
jgi:SAM-dependent methyltransferase